MCTHPQILKRIRSAWDAARMKDQHTQYFIRKT
jgi:hypothetical protein